MAQSAVSLKTLIGEEKLLIECPAGLTIGELLDVSNVPHDLRGYVVPLNHGLPIKDLAYVTRPGDRITFAVMPQGRNGAMILGAIALIALAVVAPYLGGLVAGSVFGLTAGTTAYTLASSAVALGITMLGSLLVSALIPPPSVANTPSQSVASPLQESPTYNVSGQSNQARKYSPIPRIYGRHRFFPNIAGTPLVENEGKTSRITALYDFGYGDIAIQDLKIGDLTAEVIKPDIQIHENTKTPSLRLVSKNVAYDQLQYKLEKDQPVVIRTKDDAITAAIDITFPRGLVRYDAAGNRVVATVAMEVYYRKFGDTAWIKVPSSRYRGVGVDIETFIWVTAYIKNKTEWVETNFNGGDNKWSEVVIRSNNVLILKRTFGLNQIPGTLTVGASQYRRGGSRESSSPNVKTTINRFELQTGTPIATKSTILSEATGQAVTCAVNIPFMEPAVYEIQVIRKSDTSDSNTLYNESFLTLIKSFKSGKVINLDKPHTLLEMSVVASDKISGVVQNLSAICMSRLRWHDGTAWQPPVETRNPVWIVLDILTGDANKTPLRDDQLDMPSWLALAALCDEEVTTTVDGITYTQPRYMCDVVIDFRTTVQEIVSSILSMCRAQMIITQSGKYGVLIDDVQTVPRQVFTPANSWGFSGVRAFTDRPDAFRVKFIDPELAWQSAEFNVYADGVDETTAKVFEDLQTFGITSYSQAYRYAKYMFAQGVKRSEIFSLKTDVENLAVQRGELVHVAHDVPKVGGVFARVKSISSSEVTIDQAVDLTPQAYTVRLSDGTIRSGSILSWSGSSTFTLDDATGIETGDLIVIGETDRVVGEYLVLDITPGADLTADISLVPYAPEIYAAGEQTVLPTFAPMMGRIMFAPVLLAVDRLTATTEIIYRYRRPIAKISLKWRTIGDNLLTHTISVDIEGMEAFNLEPTQEQSRQWLIDLIANPEMAGKLAIVTVVPYGRGDFAGASKTIEVTIPTDTAIPATPANFGLNVQSETVVLFWQASTEPDIDYYEIRYTPEVISPSWESAQQLARASYLQTRVTAGARTGSYMIRAVDTSGNKSPTAIQRTTVEELPNINVIEYIDDSAATPTVWPGTVAGLDKAGGVLVSSGAFGSVTPTGVYMVSQIIDLGEIYETRISSFIEAFGAEADDFVSGWPTLDAIPIIATGVADRWDAWLEVSVSEEQPLISTWPTLSAISPIGGLTYSAWSEWRPVSVGDFTGRMFRFRIIAESYDPNVKVVVKKGGIAVDMPDRIFASNDIAIPSTGLRIDFDPPFAVTPAIAVSIDGNVDALVANVSNKDATGFDLVLKTPAGVATAGQVDVMAKGYGRKRAASI